MTLRSSGSHRGQVPSPARAEPHRRACAEASRPHSATHPPAPAGALSYRPGVAFDAQVVIASAAPHDQADWWAEALGWQVEEQDEAFIRRMVDTGAASEEETTRHRGALVWKVGAAIRSPDP